MSKNIDHDNHDRTSIPLPMSSVVSPAQYNIYTTLRERSCVFIVVIVVFLLHSINDLYQVYLYQVTSYKYMVYAREVFRP